MYTWLPYNIDNELFVDGDFNSVDDCMKDAKKVWAATGYEPTYNKIYVGKVVPIQIKKLVNFLELLECVKNNMAEETLYAEEWDISTIDDDYVNRRAIYDKYDKKLKKLVEDYIEEIGETPDFSILEDIQEADLLDYMTDEEIANMNRVVGNAI